MMTDPSSTVEPIHARLATASAAASSSEPHDLQSFLNNVDEVSSLISKLASADSRAEMEKLREDADEFIAKFALDTGGEDAASSKSRREVDEDGMRTVFSKCSLNKANDHDAADEDDEDEDEDDEFYYYHYDDAVPPMRREDAAEGNSLDAAFRGALRKDAERLREHRRQLDDVANEWKERGNEAFKAGQFNQATDLYSEGLKIKKDCTALWTNRAQAYIKLEQFEAALSDCDSAIEITRDCLKAFVHRGRAYLGLKEFDAAEAALRHALLIDPKQQKAIRVYLKQVEEARHLHIQEGEDLRSPPTPPPRRPTLEDGEDDDALLSLPAAELPGDVGETLERLRITDQDSTFYSSGVKFLAMKMKDSAAATSAFRLEGGFDLMIRECHPDIVDILAKPFDDLSQPQLDLHEVLFDVFGSACRKYAEGQRRLVQTPSFAPVMYKLLEVPRPHRTKEKALTLMHALAEVEAGREAIVDTFDSARLLRDLFWTAREAPDNGATFATAIITHLAPDKRYKVKLREEFALTAIPAFEALIAYDDDRDGEHEDDSSCRRRSGADEDPPVIPSSFAVMAVLATDPELRSILAHRLSLWSLCVDLMERNVMRLSTLTPKASPAPPMPRTTRKSPYLHKLILHMLGFLINVSQDDSPHRLEFASRICLQCCVLLKLQEPKAASLWHNSAFLAGVETGLNSSASRRTLPSRSGDVAPKTTPVAASRRGIPADRTFQTPNDSLAAQQRQKLDDRAASLKSSSSVSKSCDSGASTPLEEEPHEATRALVLLSLLLPQDDAFVEDFVSRNGIAPLISFIQNGTKNQVKASVKVTAVCAQQCPSARDDIVACKKALASIVLLLKDDDEHVIGNAALCLSHCVEIPKVPEKLTKTNVVKHLLVLARDARRVGVQENCAILLAKLAMKEPRHLQRLRELHGIEILHACMKHIKT